ncbi:actin-related protein 8-like [Asterias amurensis]|uniref:actin-related protein 8-like n=1 Tax=Asterias amurensis TaxID=7602 RepID=UPI003AB5B1A1
MVEPIQWATVVVIHPGSYWLRIGRAADATPVTIPHLIARRKKDPSQPLYEDSILIRDGIFHPNSETQQEQTLKMVEQAIWSRKTSQGQRRQSVPSSEVLTYNRSVNSQPLDENSGMRWTDTTSLPEYIVGDEALYLEPADGYNIHWPIRRGRFNLHEGAGGSLTAVLQDLETIWGAVLQQKLDIPIKDLKHYRAILVIPDIYHRPHVKELMNLLLLRLGFGAAIVHQESVLATYGSGLSSACVVDVGDQKTSVCCVEDGLSHRNTRLCMTYGGSDVTRCFTWLLERAFFPYQECQPAKTMDALLLLELKETFCHLDQDLDGSQLLDFHVRYPYQPTLMYQLKLGDETFHAPMGLFYPLIFGVIGEKMTYTQQRNQGDSEDIHDELYLLQTQKEQQQSNKSKTTNAPNSESSTQNADSVMTSSTNQLSSSPNSQSQNDLIQAEEAPPPTISRRISTSQSMDKPLGVDQAILHSIDCCSSDETKKKMYSCILVVGGGLSLFQGASDMLQHRVQSKMPPSFRKVVEKVEVICKSKDLDPRMTCWKGGTVLACLDTAQELWIKQKEWRKHGLKVLRERSPFVW